MRIRVKASRSRELSVESRVFSVVATSRRRQLLKSPKRKVLSSVVAASTWATRSKKRILYSSKRKMRPTTSSGEIPSEVEITSTPSLAVWAVMCPLDKRSSSLNRSSPTPSWT